ncbi:MAG TPA: hypothetical protein VFN51_02650 [Candidatus Saccharimonadales bacterium]|nr:hypothetical protein [Candidatus Saccharimonadales bacterium]
MENSKKPTKEIAAAIGVLAVVVIIVLTTSLTSRNKSNMAASTTNPMVMASAKQTNLSFKDGTYTAVGTYESPGGQESIMVSVTLKNNIVSDTSAKSGANDDIAMAYQSQFINGYKKQVIGKKISSLNLTNVSGSSLTSQGFRDAIKQIEQKAQS